MAESTKSPGPDGDEKASALGVCIAVGAVVGVALSVGAGVVIGSILASRGDGREADRQDPDA